MLFPLIAGVAFVGGMVALSRYLRDRDRQGVWEKEGHGPKDHPEEGVTYRPLEVPPSEPFD